MKRILSILSLILRIIKHLVVYLVIILPLELIGLIVLLLVLPFLSKDREDLPRLVRWFDNHELYTKQDIQDGIDGLAGDIPFRKKNNIYPYGPYNYLRNLWHRYNWLALRNPLNYFQYKVLGRKRKDVSILKKLVGSPFVGDLKGQKQGLRYMELDDNIWEIYYVKRLYGSRGLRVRIGYKISKDNKYCQWVLVINPFKKIESD